MDAALEQDIWDSTPDNRVQAFESKDGTLRLRLGNLGGPEGATHLVVQRWQVDEDPDVATHLAFAKETVEATIAEAAQDAGPHVNRVELPNGSVLFLVVGLHSLWDMEARRTLTSEVAHLMQEVLPTRPPILWMKADVDNEAKFEAFLGTEVVRLASELAGVAGSLWGALEIWIDLGAGMNRGRFQKARESFLATMPVHEVEDWSRDATAPAQEEPRRTDATPFLADAAAASLEADKLNRAAIARAIAEKVKQIWPDHCRPDGTGAPFIVHLSGRWGSGKSSILSFLRDILQKEHREKWVVIHYNAWTKSQTGHPWWSMFNAMVAEAAPQLGPVRGTLLRLNDWWWRFRVLRQTFILALLLLAILGMGGFALERLQPGIQSAGDLGPQRPNAETVVVVEKVVPLEDGSGTRTETTTLTNDPPPSTSGLPKDFWALVALSGSGLTTLIALINGINFLRGRSATTESTLSAMDGDPAKPMKTRFCKMVRAIGRPVAFCIDDLDRCDAAYVVELLQVLQTIYAEVPVLYVVAADRDWIVSAYGQRYGNFDDDLARPGRSLGHLFLEKIFQLSVTVPDLSSLDRDQYIAALTGRETGDRLQRPEDEAALRIEFGLAAPKGAEALREVAEKAVAEGNGQRARELAFETLLMAESQTAIQHQLADYADLMDPNPRAIKRLMNAYSFRQGYAFLSGIQLEADKLIRWSILDLRFPETARALALDPEGWREGSGVEAHPALADLTDGLTDEDVRALARFG